MINLENYLIGVASIYQGILTGLGGLVWHGMTNLYCNFLQIAVTDKDLEGIRLNGAEFLYNPELDTKNFLIPCEFNSELLIPTRERALVDYMRFGIAVEDDEHLMIALDWYFSNEGHDLNQLLKVAEVMGLGNR